MGDLFLSSNFASKLLLNSHEDDQPLHGHIVPHKMRKVIKAVMFTQTLSLLGLSESCMWTYILSKKALLDNICYISLNIYDI